MVNNPEPGHAIATSWFRYHRAVENYITRRAGKDRSADLTAAVFEIALAKADETSKSSELPWLLTVARNTIANDNRKLATASRKIPAISVASQTDTGYQHEDAVVVKTDVQRALRDLSESDRELLMLAYWDDLSIGLIAETLTMSRVATRVALMRARRRFAAAYARPNIPEPSLRRLR